FARIGAKLRGNRPRQKRLPAAEVADEMHHGVGREQVGDLAARGDGVVFGEADPVPHGSYPRMVFVEGEQVRPNQNFDSSQPPKPPYFLISGCFFAVSSRS